MDFENVHSLDRIYKDITKPEFAAIEIWAGYDVDGVGGAQILTRLLKKTGTLYRLKAMMNRETLEARLTQLNEDPNQEEHRCIICLNCGGMLPFNHFVDLNKVVNTKFVIIDSHRPLHLDNIRSPDRILVIDDDTLAPEEFPEYNEEDVEFWKANKEKYESSGDEDEGEELGSAFDLNNLKIRRQRRKVYESYYEGHYLAHPCTLTLYRIANVLSMGSQDLLWFPMVAAAFQYEYEDLIKDRYSEMVELLESWLQRFNVEPTDPSYDDSESVSSQLLASSVTSMGRSSSVPNKPMFVVKEEDVDIFMYRHWQLFEAMCHTSHIYAKLELWQDTGIARLKHFMATSGILPREYDQQFGSTRASLRRTLQNSLAKISHDYLCPLEYDARHSRNDCLFGQLRMPQFVRTFGKSRDTKELSLTRMSGSDVAHCVTGLLMEHVEGQPPEENFLRAFSAMDHSRKDLVRRGVDTIIRIQKELIHTARHVIVTKELREIAPAVYFSVLERGVSPMIYKNPLLTVRLGSTINQMNTINVYRVCLKNWQSTAIMKLELLNYFMCIRDKEKSTLVCMGTSKERMIVRNVFGNLFENALRKRGSQKVRHSKLQFFAHYVEVNEEDFPTFLKSMMLQLASGTSS